MEVLSVSNITGYSSHLPTKSVKLPLKYLPLPTSEDVSENFRNGCLYHSELVDLSAQKGCFFQTLQVGVTNDMRSLRLTPVLVDETTLLGLQFQNLCVDLPHQIISNRTITCQFVSNNNTTDEPFVLIDIIDQSFLLLTLRIELSDFIVGNGTHRLTLDNFSEWVNINVPYSFELRSDPFCIKALDPQNIVVSLKDGGLLHFNRETPLGDFSAHEFQGSTPVMSLSLVGLLFRNSGSGDVILNGVSLNLVVDIVKVSSDEFVALSVTKQLNFWSLKSHKQSRPKLDMSSASAENSSWLNTIPNRYLRITDCDGEGQEKRLSLFLPSSTTQGGIGSNAIFEIHNWILAERAIRETSLFSVNEAQENLTTKRNLDAGSMIIQDFYVVSHGSAALKYYLLWKCNTFSSVVVYEVNTTNHKVKTVTRTLSLAAAFEEFLSMRSDTEIIDLIFKSGNYDEEIVSSALEVFEQNLGLPATSKDLSLRRHLGSVVRGISAAQNVSVNSLLSKFALICEEFKKISQEVLTLLPTAEYVLTSQVNGVGVLRYAHFYEEFSHLANGDFELDDQTGQYGQNGQNGKNGQRLSALLNHIASRFSLRVFKQIHTEIQSAKKIDASYATQLATSYLSSKITDEEVQELMENLGSIPNVLQEITLLVDIDSHGISNSIANLSSSLSGEGCGLFSKILVVDIFKSIKKKHEHILLNVFVLLLLCEVNETVLEILNCIVNRFNSYSLMKHVFELSFKDLSSQSAIETQTVSKCENSIFWECAAARSHEKLLQLILNKEYNSAFNYYSGQILMNEKELFMLDILLELLNRDEVKVILDELKGKFDASSPVVKFLFALVSLFNNQYEESFLALKDFDNFEKFNNSEIHAKLADRLGSQKVIKHFLSAVFAHQELPLLVKANYFHQVSQLCMTYYDHLKNKIEIVGGGGIDHKTELLRNSVIFEKMAISFLENDLSSGSESGPSHTSIRVTYLRNLFSDAVEIKEYSDAIDALSEIHKSVSSSEMRGLLSKLIRALLANNKIEYIFQSSLFTRNYLLVDSILLEIGNEDLILSNALQCYEYLYSWRLFGSVGQAEGNGLAKESFGDVRGAAEALYIFITRFRLEKDMLMSETAEMEDFKLFQLRILELYKIIINCLKTFEDKEDRWIIRRNSQKSLVIATVDELAVEYYKWLRELEDGLS